MAVDCLKKALGAAVDIGGRDCLKLHLCCGFDYKKGFVNVDNVPNGVQDIKADLNKDWDFVKDRSAEYIFIKDGLEHLLSLEHFFKEASRVLKPNGKLEIWVPHFKSPSAYRTSHRFFFSWSMFNSFPEPHDPVHDLRVISNRLVVEAHVFPFTLLNSVANHLPKYWERFFYVSGLRVVLEKSAETKPAAARPLFAGKKRRADSDLAIGIAKNR